MEEACSDPVGYSGLMIRVTMRFYVQKGDHMTIEQAKKQIIKSIIDVTETDQ